MGTYEADPGWVYLRYPPDKLLKEQTRPYDSKKNVWIPDEEEGYLGGEIKSVKGDLAEITTAKGIVVTVKKDLCQEMNPPKFEKTEDMANLTFLNDASVLYNLRSRYGAMLIYTYSGLFCVVINPYKRLPIYTESVVKMYMGKRRAEMPPHLFAVSDEAYRNMLLDRENQSLLITGESGAGKTENTKKVIAYFAVVGATQQAGKADTGAKQATLEEQIVQTNPVLESFGNAKTVRNNNSSRFGKFIRVHFDRSGKMAGGDIDHYLLEKSRVIKQNFGERSYHIFYQIHSGFIPGLKERCMLDHDIKYYHFSSQAEVTIDGVDDKEECKATDEAFDILGFTPREKEEIWKLVSAIQHFGEMNFKQRPREEQAEPDGTEEATKCAAMFDINHEELLKALAKPRVKVGNEWVNKGQNLEQVNWAKGAMAKGIYSRLFGWLVKRCNDTLASRKDVSKDYWIGVLDIAGFEIFDYMDMANSLTQALVIDIDYFKFNSFEQQWINFVNEKLQQFFNHHMFVLEQEEYKREEIPWEFIDFGLDLAACIELIEKPLGIISMLDEECIVPKATDLTYAQKLNDQHLGKHPNFVKPAPPKGKQAEAHYALKHYAGTVRYNVTSWLEKNKDPLNDSVVQVMKTQDKNQLLLEIWSDYVTQEEAAQAQKEGKEATKKKGKSASFMTVSMIYRESLNKLMTMLNQTHPHFVRCIIPNELKRSGLLDSALVMNQLTCNGVLEGIRICRKGFPNRLQHADFRQRYAILAADAAKSSKEPKVAANAVLDQLIKEGALTKEQFKVGLTKVFFKAGVLAALEDMRDQKLSAIMKSFQSRVRSYVYLVDCKKRKEQMAGNLIIQRNIREWLELRTWQWFKLLGWVKPLLKQGKAQEEMDALLAKLKEFEDNYKKENKLRTDIDAQMAKLQAEKDDLHAKLASERDHLADYGSRTDKLQSAKDELERDVSKMTSSLNAEEDKYAELLKAKKRAEQELEQTKKRLQELEMNLRKSQSETQSRDHQIRSLQDEMHQQDELIAKLNKERKHQEEVCRKLTEDLQSQEDKVNHLNKVKAKLEQNLDELEDSLERERHLKQDVEKAKRKVEGDLKVAQENIEEVNKQKHDVENNLRRKEQELSSMNNRLEDEQSLVAKLQKQIKELQGKIEELEEELNSERQAHSKAEKAKSDIQHEVEELSERIEEAGGSAASQAEMNKKREAELAKLRRDLEEANLNHENQLAALRKKHQDAVAEMTDQLDQLTKQRSKLEKDKAMMQRDVEALHATIDAESKAKSNAEKNAKNLEMQLAELQAKVDEQARQLNDFANIRARLANENSDLVRQAEDADAQIQNSNRMKQQILGSLEESKRMADDEARERQNLAQQLRNAQTESDTLRGQLEEETEAKNEMLRQVAKANAEVQQWKAKYDTEGLAKGEELEEAKRKLSTRLQELSEQMETSNSKLIQLDKARQRMLGELDDAQVDVERANTYAASLEKKQQGFDRVVEEWGHKCADARSELDASQRDNRNLSTDVFQLKNQNDEINEQIEGVRRENKQVQQEIKDLTDQLGEGGRAVHELQKMVRRLELEKEELQQALDEAERALEAEESKVLRSQIEISQTRSEIEKRIQEKEEEFENTRKNHQRALDSMQASLEAEAKGRAELLRVKKQLEGDINELEIALDHANKANADAQKNLKRTLEQIKELQIQVEEEQRQRDEVRDQFHSSEKRCSILQAEKDELFAQYENVEHARRQADLDSHDAREQLNEVLSQNQVLNGIKRKLEGEIQALHADLDESLAELKSSEEESKKAMIDAARVAEELRQEQDRATQSERQRRGLEQTTKELQVRLEEAEQAALKGGKKTIQKLEERIRQVETEIDGEQRRHAEAQKTVAKNERRVRELQFQFDEDKKNYERLQDLIDKLQQKIKTYKRQVEEAEEVASQNLNKFKAVQHQLEDAEERADVAENALQKLRSKNREGPGARPGGLAHSVSSGAVLRSGSRGAGF